MIPALVDWLSGTQGYQNSFVYQGISQHVEDETQGKSYALRLLIHYLGDIHQPLHASSRVDKQYPKGDAGGNFFHVTPKDDAKNLHSVWDSVVYAYPDTPSMVNNSLISIFKCLILFCSHITLKAGTNLEALSAICQANSHSPPTSSTALMSISGLTSHST